MSQSERFEVGQKKNVEIIFLVNLRLSFSETIESPDSSISYFIEISQDWVCDPNLYSLPTLTVEILQDLVLHLPFKSVIVFTFNSFLYYIPVIQEFFSTSIFKSSKYLISVLQSNYDCSKNLRAPFRAHWKAIMVACNF